MWEKVRFGRYPALALWGEPVPDGDCFTLSFTGDFGFWNRAPDPAAVERHLEQEAPLLARFDLRVLNLEFILPGSRGDDEDPRCERASLDIIRRSGFQVVSLANNHAAAFGEAGLDHNLRLLDKAGLAVIGLRDRPVHRFRAAGVEIAIFSLTDLLDDENPSARILRSRREDVDFLADEMASADFRIGFPHLGSRSVYPSPHELKQARELIDAGTDLLVCTGAHFPKGFVEIEGRPVCFGLGNYLFGWAGGSTEAVGMHLVAGFQEGRLHQLHAIPFHNAVMEDRTGPLDEEAFLRFAENLRERSTTDVSRFYADPLTQAGALERLRGLRPAELRKLRPRHVVYGLRALAARLFRR